MSSATSTSPLAASSGTPHTPPQLRVLCCRAVARYAQVLQQGLRLVADDLLAEIYDNVPDTLELAVLDEHLCDRPDYAVLSPAQWQKFALERLFPQAGVSVMQVMRNTPLPRESPHFWKNVAVGFAWQRAIAAGSFEYARQLLQHTRLHLVTLPFPEDVPVPSLLTALQLVAIGGPFPHLQMLHLRRIDLPGDGQLCHELARAIESLSALQRLSLEMCALDREPPEAQEHLMQALESLSALRSLSLQWCGLTPALGRRLCAVLGQHARLQQVDVRWNALDGATRDALARAARARGVTLTLV